MIFIGVDTAVTGRKYRPTSTSCTRNVTRQTWK